MSIAAPTLITPPSRLAPGDVLTPFTLDTLAHGAIAVPSRGLVHLQFRRFAGCPICNLHLRSVARSVDAIRAAGIEPIALFHSSAEVMRPFQGDLPFPVVADPARIWYARFGVEQAASAAWHPRAIWSGLKGLVVAPSSPFRGEGGHAGLPAEFLIDATGQIRAAHYGAHADDQWSVAMLLAIARDA